MALHALTASQLQAKGQRLELELPGAAALLDAGGPDSLNPKLWVCEDSLALSETPSGWLALIADSHWGGAASEIVARGLARAWERAARAPSLEKRLVKALLLLEAQFLAERPRGDRSETTLLLAHLDAEALRWVNVGDSLLYGLRADAPPRLLNRPNGFFLGNRPLAALGAWTSGACQLTGPEAPTAFLLASDGLEPRAAGLEPDELPGLLATGPAGSGAALRGLAARACDPASGGGRDNLALIYLAAARVDHSSS